MLVFGVQIKKVHLRHELQRAIFKIPPCPPLSIRRFLSNNQSPSFCTKHKIAAPAIILGRKYSNAQQMIFSNMCIKFDLQYGGDGRKDCGGHFLEERVVSKFVLYEFLDLDLRPF